MKVFLLNLIVLAGFLSSQAQNGCTAKKAWAYYNVSMPGTQMADENGNPVPVKANIVRIIYLEYSGTKAPEVQSVLYNNVAMNFTVIKLVQKSLTVGDAKLNQGNTVTAKKGNSLLQVSLQPRGGNSMPETGCKKIVIKTVNAGKTCTLNLTSEKQFFSPPTY